MNCTGGSYPSVPCGSAAVQRCLTWGGARTATYHPYQVQAPYPSYGAPTVARSYGAPTVAPSYGAPNVKCSVCHRGRPASAGTRPVSANNIYLQECARYEPVSPRPSSAAAIPHYTSLNDPHLRDFFLNKFFRPSRGAKMQRCRKSSADAAAECLYKVDVTTGERKYAGTDARVYIRLIGERGELRGHRLKSGSLPSFTFRKGSCHMFKWEDKDIGRVTSLVLEHDGITKREAWFVEEVDVRRKNLRTGQERSWVFPCLRWLSLHHDDCKTNRQLYPCASTSTEYEVVVVTGDILGAGTDASVSLTVFGRTGQTTKLQLYDPSRHCFQRAQTDTFLLKTKCVGELTKIRIEHDNTNMGPGWFLDRVVVKDLKNPDWLFYFHCGNWLAKTEGDKQICRDLLGSKDPNVIMQNSKYTVTVYTGSCWGAGTDANVYVTLFGELGDSGEKKLTGSGNKFEKGDVDTFSVDCPALGVLQRLRIGHDNTGAGPGWFLDKVVVDDVGQHQVYEFLCGRWLARDEDDGQTQRELVVGGGADDRPGVPYTISVFTGDRAHAGTSAKVYMVMYGGKDGEANSGKIILNGKFSAGRTDITEVETAEKLSPLSRIEVGHDDSGVGAGWFLDKVVVHCASAGVEQEFPCYKWLAKDEGDRLIQRTLYEKQRKEFDKQMTWQVWVHTSDIARAGTNSKVWLVAYGKNKRGESVKSDEISLETKGDSFEQGETDMIKIEMCKIGTPYKLRVGHDNTGAFAGWHLNRIEMQSLATGDRYDFLCDRWLARDEDDHSTIREMAAQGDTITKPEPLVQYKVFVHTGSKTGAGTDANVFLNLFGEQGDTGERPLTHSQNINKFERGNVDEFTLEAVRLKQLTKIRIGHDNTGAGPGWFIHKVVVSRTDRPDSTPWTFLCDSWLDCNEGDGQIVKEFTPAGKHLLTTSYHVRVVTGRCHGAGTDANVSITLYGEHSDTGRRALKQSEGYRNKFEKGQTDKFTIDSADIGKIKKLRIGHDSAHPGSGWFLDEVQVDVPSRGESYLFTCNRWLDKSEADGKTEIEVAPTQHNKGQKALQYEVTVWTGDVDMAGTNATVKLVIYGENGQKTEEYPLKNKTNNFEQGQEDYFKIEAKDVGPIKKVRIGHDGSGLLSGWFLDKMRIQRHLIEGSRPRQPKPRRGSRVHESRDQAGQVEDYWFVCGSWFSKGEGDGLIVRELAPTAEDGGALEGALQDVTYKVSVVTGSARGAGTDANVFVKLSGTEGDSGEVALLKSQNRNKFESKQTDLFTVKTLDLGELTKLRIRHDNSKIGAGWYLDKVEVEDTITNRRYTFPCNKWLATDEDDGQISRELIPSQNINRKNGHQRVVVHDETYMVSVYTGSRRGAGTDANVYIILYGDKDDTGKVDLKRSKTNRNKFEDNKMDQFEVQAVDLGDIEKIKIGHDNSKFGAGWFLDRVEVKCVSVDKSWVFLCNQWLATDEDDGKIERELYPENRAKGNQPEYIPYEIATVTGKDDGAGTDADVYVILYGAEGETDEYLLQDNTHRRGKHFMPGKTDIFPLEMEDVGEIETLAIGIEGKKSPWLLEKVNVVRGREKKLTFKCGEWLHCDQPKNQLHPDKGRRNSKLRQTANQKRDSVPIDVTYTVSVYTGSRWGAGTDANVYIFMFGDKDSTDKVNLKESKTYRNKFEDNHIDTFDVKAMNLGDINNIIIGHDNSGLGPGWFLDKVEVECESLNQSWVFPCNRWLSKTEDDRKIERELRAQNSSTEHHPARNLSSSRHTANRQSHAVDKDIEYEITTFTSDKISAGTDADVYVILYGEHGQTKRHSLCPNPEDCKKRFERRAIDTFHVTLADVGAIEKLCIGHDGRGRGAGWHLNKVEVVRGNGKRLTFPCDEWLDKPKDGKIERILYPQ